MDASTDPVAYMKVKRIRSYKPRKCDKKGIKLTENENKENIAHPIC